MVRAMSLVPPFDRPLPLSDVSPDDVCEALAPLLVDGRRERIDAVVASRLGGLHVLIENLHDPHNGAAVLRSAESFGIQTVHVVEAVEPFRFSSTVTQGCEKWLDIVRHPDFSRAARTLRSQGVALYAAVPEATTPLEALDFSRPAAIMVGNEHAGLTELAQREADVCFTIPMAGMTRSLNLSVATAICAEHAARARRKTLGDGRTGDLSPEACRRLRARFYVESVRGAEEVVARFVRSRRRDG
jgi:tRNA (guanosine-2'-O-)-methyltransferase